MEWVLWLLFKFLSGGFPVEILEMLQATTPMQKWKVCSVLQKLYHTPANIYLARKFIVVNKHIVFDIQLPCKAVSQIILASIFPLSA